MLELPLG